MQELNCPLCIGVGGTFDVMAGVMKRAPLGCKKPNLEWLFRGYATAKTHRQIDACHDCNGGESF